MLTHSVQISKECICGSNHQSKHLLKGWTCEVAASTMGRPASSILSAFRSAQSRDMGQELQPSLRASGLMFLGKTPEDYGAALMQKYHGQTSMFCKEVQFTATRVPPVTSRTACQHASETPSPHLALPRLAAPSLTRWVLQNMQMVTRCHWPSFPGTPPGKK